MRNNTNTRIVIPQYANLRMYIYGYEFSVTFNIKENLVNYLNKCKDTRIFTFKKGNKYYASIKQNFSYSGYNMEAVIWYRLPRMKQLLLIAIREAKIAALNDEIRCLKLFD